MIKTINILILEDDLETLQSILHIISRFTNAEWNLTVLNNYNQVEKWVNNGDFTFDLILLDRDCSLGGSFHVLNFEKFSESKIIAISSVPDYNQQVA